MLKRVLLYCSVLLILVWCASGRKHKVKTLLQPQNIELCSMNDELPMRYLYVKTINQGKGVVGYDALLVSNKTISDPIGHMKMTRCTEQDVAGTCEHFIKVSDVDLCKGLVYQTVKVAFFDLFHPKLSCPIQPGTYNFTQVNAETMISDALLSFITPDPKYFWKLKFLMFDASKRLMFCSKLTLKIVQRKV